MIIGKKDQEIYFSSVVESNAGGELTRTWTPETQATWAGIYAQGGDEAFQSARVNAREVIRVNIRFRDDITTEHRFSWDGLTYSILYVDRTKRRKDEMWLTAELVGAP